MDHREMHVIEHIEELRKRIIFILIGFILSFLISFLFIDQVYQFLIRDLNGQLALLGPGDIIWVYMMMAGVVAVATTIPIAAYQLWRFVQPALTREERKVTLAFIPGLFFLFLAGIAFGYYVLFPLVLSFVQSLAGEQFETFYTVDKYIRFMINISLPFGFLFEMPAVVMYLTRLGLINPVKLAKLRKYSYFILVVISVLITPPDFISDILVIIPLFLLYETSILLSKIIYRGTEGQVH
ncbi:twin-arginine translocase subunit TatC [Salinibacillus xinjiangensis]|uniref:Sec-independent protein translocase protein TatC n=1 Tax=Salinibacillus xinjiangensis TaxID=1229268 RepID=A0A6G1XAN3_9BACI|nr:twin-arginine translocase subunit TatC [Salinibacillus xinjiangensis]MRG88071.1 twin-arginine translocase subunit TatC [Salinibacillus xinjiangensis]